MNETGIKKHWLGYDIESKENNALSEDSQYCFLFPSNR